MRIRKVLGFDNWTQGSRHFERLLPACDHFGLSLKLVHLGSWGNDPGRARNERIGRLEVSDISSYPGESLQAVLDLEKPDAVLLFSTATFAHRAFLRYCRKRSIPSIHVYHGLMSVQVTEDHQGSQKINWLAHANLVLSKLGKLVRRTFPCYIRALLETDAAIGEWMRFGYDVGKMALGLPLWQPNVARDATTTTCAVFTEIERRHAHRVYHVPFEDIHAVGNPDLMGFGLSEDLFASYDPQSPEGPKSEIMYLDSGLVMLGQVFRNLEAFADHLRHTARTLGTQGYRLCVKAHPSVDQGRLTQLLDGSGIDLVSREEFLPRLRRCAACIAEVSSVTLIPALMGIPLLYANYGQLSQLRFGPILSSYPRGARLTDVPSSREAIERIGRSEPSSLRAWIAANSGPLPASDMPMRVATLIDRIIQKSSRKGIG